MKNFFKKTPSESKQKAIKLSKLNKEKKILKDILSLFDKNPYNPTTYCKIWKLLMKLHYEDLPKYTDVRGTRMFVSDKLNSVESKISELILNW